ncbi:hypothetical protein [Roseomonas sp. USHLN139]|uniref:hypothetical protein n=1 Tax=Roseomonas sp. USHLN139 TaxID=3081298 RepID=UPI003B0250CA
MDRLTRLLLLAAVADFSPAEMREIFERINGTNPEDLEAKFREIRKNIRGFDAPREADEVDLEAVRLRSVRQDIVNLFQPTGMLSAEAAVLLSGEIHSMYGANYKDIPPFNKKEGFLRWVERLIRHLGPSAVLNASIQAVSKKDKKSEEDWRLS